jgi:hypothetical protein
VPAFFINNPRRLTGGGDGVENVQSKVKTQTNTIKRKSRCIIFKVISKIKTK